MSKSAPFLLVQPAVPKEFWL